LKKLLLLSALCMTFTLLLVSVAAAQGFTPPGPADGVCEGSGEGDPDCAEALRQGLEDQAPGIQYAPESGVSCDQFIALGSGEPSQFQAQQFYDFVATPEEQAILDPDGNGFACDNGTIEFGVDPAENSDESPEEASATYSALPDTGGPSLLLPISILLVGTGILGLVAKRRTS
jgi:hypothetical protein